MFLNQKLLNLLAEKDPDNPIYSEGEEQTIARIIEVMYDEQWRELGRQYQFCEKEVIQIPNFGKFYVHNSFLRRYIREGIRNLRRLRERIEKLKETKPDFNPNDSLTAILEKDLKLKIRVAWKQLDAIRHYWIQKAKMWEEKKRLKQENVIKV